MTNHIFWRNAGGVSILTIALLTVCAFISACSEDFHLWTEEASGNPISIGGIDTDAMMVSGISSRATGATRATGVAAESMAWLLQPLKEGIDITYGWSDPTSPNNQQDVAILKLKDSDGTGDKPYATENGLAVYDFCYRQNSTTHTTNNAPAIWYDNGPHYFQGVHVPERIRYTSDATEVYSETTGKAKNLTLDQHDGTTTGEDDKLGNYTLLSHYLGMPANFKLTATIERIKLPFRHRLARVIAFVLIDPELNTTLKGYKKNAEGQAVADEDPTTTSFRFCNVKVLQGVKDEVGADDHHTLTPTWYEARKVIPHFEGEKGSYSYKTNQELDGDNNFKYYYKYDDNGRLQQLFPTSKGWEEAHKDTGKHNGYTEVDYGKVPVYDIIVRPTYTRADSVMYDEEGLDPKADDYKTKLATYAAVKNKIDFEIELENGLRYEKRFEFDLNANYQTVVYLRVAREHVDYNDAGSELWIEEKNDDAWYGVDNENGNTLSLAGSSWQRAYTYGAVVTNGTETPSTPSNPHPTEGVTDGHFYNASSTAAERENAQYFTSEYQEIWVRKFLQAYQGGDHHGDYFILQDDITIDACLIPDNFVFTGHLDGQDHIIKLTNTGQTVVDQEARDEDHYVSATDGDYSSTLFVQSGDAYVAYTMPTLYTKVHHDAVLYTEGDEIPDGKKVGDVKTEAYDEYVEAHPTIAELMSSTTYYSDNLGNVYPKPTLYANHPIHHDAITHQSPAYLFAGLDGEYTTAQESDPSIPNWEANVHLETNDFGSGTHWVPTLGYRAEVINVRVATPATLFKDDATITGNVQNCWNKWNTDKSDSEKVSDHTPAIPQYK